MKGKFGFGSVWTWTAICADTKLMISWLVGECRVPYAVKFIDDLASRLAHRVQLTTDGHKPYLRAIEGAFGSEIDYAMLGFMRLGLKRGQPLDTVRPNVAGPRRIGSLATPTMPISRLAMQRG